jgi:tetratricopeptide (TPR) repeat protein
MSKKQSVNKAKNREKQKSQEACNKQVEEKGELSPLVFQIDNFNHSEFLQRQGEKKLLQGEPKGIALFELAAQFDSQNPIMFYEQGVALFEYGREVKVKKYLLLANKSFKEATRLDPNYFVAWQAWGKSLSLLGNLFNEHHFYLSAKTKYEKALIVKESVKNDLLSDFYWQYASVMEKIGDHSKEIFDLNIALEAYSVVLAYSEEMPIKFWQDFGNLCLKLASQVNDINLYMKAINCFRNGINRSTSNSESWHYLGIALSQLYEITFDEDHFCQANECFTNAAKLHPQNTPIWKDWAKLLSHSGKRLNDAKRLHSCIEKCHKAYSCNRKDVDTLIIWSEALSHLGLITERLDLIFEGNNKAVEAEDRFTLSPEIYYAFGMNLFALGKYHSDIDYYYQAIEKFQEGLSMCRTSHKLWFHLAYTYAVVAEIESDFSLYERSCKFYQKALYLNPQSSYYYEYGCILLKLAEANHDRTYLELALSNFEEAFNLQKNAVYLRPEWLYQYALALDLKGDVSDEEKFYVKALEILKRVLMLDPEFPDIHYKIALIYSHLGELIEEGQAHERAIAHYKIAYQKNEENDTLLLDWALTLINLAQITPQTEEREQLWKEAEYKFIQAAKLGNTEVSYHLACLYSLMMHYEKAIYHLERAEFFDALPPLDEVLEDEWLENLRQTEVFRSFINHLQA